MQDHCKDTERDTGSPTGDRVMAASPLQALLGNEVLNDALGALSN